jgi:hypothetical protein
MMTQSIVLFVHIAAVIAMFACLAVEAFGAERARNAVPRASGLAVMLTIISGLYLGARFGVLGAGWMDASYAGIVAMAAAGAVGHGSCARRRLSFVVRTSFGLAVVLLMTAKPDGLDAAIVLGAAVVASALGVGSTRMKVLTPHTQVGSQSIEQRQPLRMP